MSTKLYLATQRFGGRLVCAPWCQLWGLKAGARACVLADTGMSARMGCRWGCTPPGGLPKGPFEFLTEWGLGSKASHLKRTGRRYITCYNSVSKVTVSLLPVQGHPDSTRRNTDLASHGGMSLPCTQELRAGIYWSIHFWKIKFVHLTV